MASMSFTVLVLARGLRFVIVGLVPARKADRRALASSKITKPETRFRV